MNRRQLFLTALAGGHLLLVACGAAGLFRAVPPTNPPARAAHWYGAMSGASMGYGFFAPAVGSQPRAVFVMTDSAGHTWQDDLEAGRNQEVKLRVGSVISTFPADDSEEALRQDLLASWAATMFGRHPRATKVEIRVQTFDVPSMEEYRAGARPEWVTAYGATFTRSRAEGARAERRAP